jgi:hypothetical protein
MFGQPTCETVWDETGSTGIVCSQDTNKLTPSSSVMHKQHIFFGDLLFSYSRNLFTDVPPKKPFWWMVYWQSARSSRNVTCSLCVRKVAFIRSACGAGGVFCFCCCMWGMHCVLVHLATTWKISYNISSPNFIPQLMLQPFDLSGPHCLLSGCSA